MIFKCMIFKYMYDVSMIGGVNYTLTASEMVGQRIEKLANKTLMVTTTTVCLGRAAEEESL